MFMSVHPYLIFGILENQNQNILYHGRVLLLVIHTSSIKGKFTSISNFIIAKLIISFSMQ